MSYTTPPIITATSYGAIETYSAIQAAPALLTRFTPPSQCSTDWYWDTAALRSSSTVFSDAAHNSQWNTCQPYNITSSTYSAGICPDRSEFKTATQVSWDGVSEPYYLGACCASTASLQTYASGDATGLSGCVVTATQSEVVATWVQENSEPTVVTSKGPITVIAEPLYMVWNQADTALHPESDANSLRAAMGMALSSSSSSSFSTSAAAPVETQTSNATSTLYLSHGAIAGIVVGFVVCLIALLILGYLAFIHRGRIKPAPSKKLGTGESTGSTNAWESRDLHTSQLQVNIPGTTNKSPSIVELHRLESAGSQTPQTPYTPQVPNRTKDEELFAVEQKMLLR